MAFESHPLVRIDARADHDLDQHSYPSSIPAIAQVLREGLAFGSGVTFLVGENGSGKSTLVEAIALAHGLSPEGGSRDGHHRSRPSESGLWSALQPQRGVGAPRSGFFLRAETMHSWFSYIEQIPGGTHPDYHSMSHGESFTAVIEWATDPGFSGLLIMDEPEAALSFGRTLRLISQLHQAAAHGTQIICATHSPILASLPDATILEVGEWGIRARAWEELEMVEHWRRYLDSPGRYLRHLLD